MKKFVFLYTTIFIVATFFVGCSGGGAGTTNNYYTGAQVPTTTTGGTTNVTILVVNNSNGLPIEKASVKFKEINLVRETDVNGLMKENKMISQLYTLRTEKDLYNPDELPIIPSGEFNFTVRLKPKTH